MMGRYRYIARMLKCFLPNMTDMGRYRPYVHKINKKKIIFKILIEVKYIFFAKCILMFDNSYFIT